MCIIKDVSDWLCHEFYLVSIQNCSSTHNLQSLLLLVSTREQEGQLSVSQQLLSIQSHPILSPLSHPISSHPVHFCVHWLWAAQAPSAHLPALPLYLSTGCASWLEAKWFTFTNRNKQNTTGSTSINCCFPCPQGSQSSFLLIQSTQHLYYSPHLGDRKCEMSQCVQSHWVHHQQNQRLWLLSESQGQVRPYPLGIHF